MFLFLSTTNQLLLLLLLISSLLLRFYDNSFLRGIAYVPYSSSFPAPPITFVRLLVSVAIFRNESSRTRHDTTKRQISYTSYLSVSRRRLVEFRVLVSYVFNKTLLFLLLF